MKQIVDGVTFPSPEMLAAKLVMQEHRDLPTKSHHRGLSTPVLDPTQPDTLLTTLSLEKFHFKATILRVPQMTYCGLKCCMSTLWSKRRELSVLFPFCTHRYCVAEHGVSTEPPEKERTLNLH